MSLQIDIHERIYGNRLFDGYTKNSIHQKIGILLTVSTFCSSVCFDTFSLFRISTDYKQKKAGFYYLFVIHKIFYKICKKIGIPIFGDRSFVVIYSKIIPFGPVKIRNQNKLARIFYWSIIKMNTDIFKRVQRLYKPKTLDLITYLIKRSNKYLLKYAENL